MGYDYGFEYAFPEVVEGVAEGAFVGAAGILVAILMLVYFVMLALGVVSYVLSSVGMYRIAKRRGIHHAWLAWIPVGNAWLLGSISDHYQYVAKQKQTSRRKILLILHIILVVVSGGFIGSAVGTILPESAATATSVVGVALMTICYLCMMGLAIAIAVFCYIAYFDLFRSCKPKCDVLFLVLGIFFNVTLPFFTFACSGSDEGMPARRVPQPPVQIPYQAAEVPAEEPAAPQWEPQQEEIPVVETEIVEDTE